MRGRLIVGLLLVLLGIGAILDLSGAWDFSTFLGTWWPLLLIGIGVAQLVRGQWFGPAILILLGAFFLARNLGYFDRLWGKYVWPVLLVIIGLSLVFGALRNRGTPEPTTTGKFDRFAMFGGIDERVTGPFEGGSVFAMFGGADIDLREAEISDGCVIDATVAFGGIGILVPAGTRVRITGTPIFGGVENKVEAGDGPRLTVKGVAMFGGIEVKDHKD